MDSTVDLSGLGFVPLVVPVMLALPWRGVAPLRVWRVEYRWTHKGSGQSGRAVLEFPALGQVAYRIEIGEVWA